MRKPSLDVETSPEKSAHGIHTFLQQLMCKMEGFILRNLALLFVLPVVLLESHSPVVITKTGPVRGRRCFHEGIAVDEFLGIPYATPPVGDLRFKKTVPVEKWTDILDATRKPPACWQVPQYSIGLDTKSVQTEDCLYLNIWAPSTAKKERKKAVMVWIYGGGFTQGSSAKPIYDGRVLAANGDVIFVSMNYRLNIMGFCTSQTEDAPGNAGMFDQVEALKWTKENIEEFGGDASCITLFGVSAGSSSASAHALSPLSKDLFHRAIMESGSIAALSDRFNNAKLPTQTNLEFSDQTAKAVGCSDAEKNIRTAPEAVIECLREVDPRNLTDASAHYLFLPQYNDDFMPNEEGRMSIIEGKLKKDLLIGVNADEGSIALVGAYTEMSGEKGKKNEHPVLSRDQARDILTQGLPLFGFDPAAAMAITEYYLSKAHGDNNTDVLRQTYTAIGDCIILCPSVYTAEKVAQQGKTAYFYKFEHRPCIANKDFGEWMGVAHSVEVQFVFGLPLRRGSRCYTKKDKDLSKRIIKFWTDFAKTGSPSSHWPLYSRDNPWYKVLNTSKHPKNGYGPSREDCDFLRPFNGYT